jgi:hypothetical protein
MLIAGGGCWEEIRYEPQAEAPKPSPPDEVAAEPTQPTDDAATATEVPIASAPPVGNLEPPAPPTADELFDDQPAQDFVQPPEDGGVEADVAVDPILPTPAETSQLPTTIGPAADPDAMAAAATPEQRRLAWRAASKWSLAAAIHAKGLAAARYEPILAEATASARELGLELPPLPMASRPGDLEGAVIEGLRGESAVALMNSLAHRFGPTESAAADLAIRSHLLLLTYSPRSADTALQAEALRRAAEASSLPAESWEPLLKLVQERAAFVDVRQAVFDLHRRVDGFLATDAASSE